MKQVLYIKQACYIKPDANGEVTGNVPKRLRVID